ncbi:MAG: DUF2934 domain-containing protein [Lentisphaerae bacterium]|nr:DUF2934 domain-containing protein [Lentisphaerota bacterium]
MPNGTKPKKRAAARRNAVRKLAPEERYRKIQEEAYLRAERDGFQKDPVEYWLAAESVFKA